LDIDIDRRGHRCAVIDGEEDNDDDDNDDKDGNRIDRGDNRWTAVKQTHTAEDSGYNNSNNFNSYVRVEGGGERRYLHAKKKEGGGARRADQI
jgi:hypothetical protein